MSILSMEFLGFAALMILVYYLLPLRVRWLALLGFSAAFVVQSGWQGGAHLLALSIIAWLGALGLGRLRAAENAAPSEASARTFVRLRRLLLFFLLTLDLGSMALLKFYPALAAWLNEGALRATPLPTGAWLLPLGLSYFSFQAAGYLIDVYRGKAEAAKNPLRALLFIGYFLYLPQGPISTWKELGNSLSQGHSLDFTQFVSGFQLAVWGYFKKLVIADRLAIVTAAVLKLPPKMPGWLAMGGAVLYALRLYTDFSGGVDVVRGVSRMVGVELPENFRRPFFAVSIADYWRRWHITLGAWFRSYLLYPLASCPLGLALGRGCGRLLGKKLGRMAPTALGTVLVFFLIGIWHGVTWNAAYYGLYFGLLMALSLLLSPLWKWLNRTLRLPKGGWMTPVRMARTWALALLPQFFAFAPTPEKALSLIGRAFTFSEWDFSTFVVRCKIIMPELEWYILIGAVALLLIVDILSERQEDLSGRLAQKPLYIRWPLIILLILAVAVFGCYGTDFVAADFVYTQF